MVHGVAAAAAAEEASSILFGGDPTSASVDALEMVAAEAGRVQIGPDELSAGVSAVDVAVAAELASSKGEARRLIEQGGIRINGRVLAAGDVVTANDLLSGQMALLRRGKKQWRVLVSEKI